MLLAIDTSTRYAGVALMDKEGRLCQLLHWHSQQNHTVELLPAIEATLARQKLSLKELSGIAIALGPGSFSALRVGLSVAKGLAWTAGLPLVSATTLATEAFPFAPVGTPVCAILDAGRGEVAWALYQPAQNGLALAAPEAIGQPVDVLAALPDSALVCGEGLERFGPSLADSNAGRVKLALPYHAGVRVVALARIGWRQLQSGQIQEPAALQPFYLRRPSISEPSTPFPS